MGVTHEKVLAVVFCKVQNGELLCFTLTVFMSLYSLLYFLSRHA